MQFERYTDIHRFYDDTYDLLLSAEAENLIMEGNILRGHAIGDTYAWHDPATWFMATVREGEDILIVALMTPPYELTLFEVVPNDDALACLVRGIRSAGVSLPGVMCESSLALRFARAYERVVRVEWSIAVRQRIYELTEVSSEVPIVGSLRPVEEPDMCYVPYWAEAFCVDSGLPSVGSWGSDGLVGADLEPYQLLVTSGLHILVDQDTPVSMARLTRTIRTVAGVGYVYTPPYYRGHGYASSCVAQLSRLILETGFTRCVLYTDLANPISNSIYQKIGYTTVCDSHKIQFR
jgi:GNAT superfamily N-acetyltransferase